MNTNLLRVAELSGFILSNDKQSIDWNNNYDEQLATFAAFAKQLDSTFVFVCESCAKKLSILDIEEV